MIIQHQGRRQDFGEEGTSGKLSYMNLSKVLYCTVHSYNVYEWRRKNLGGGEHSAKIYSTETFKKFWKFYIKFGKNLKYSPKFFRNKI